MQKAISHIAFLIVTGICHASIFAAGTFPYQVAVQQDRAAVRSGPGDAYYVTATLKTGEIIEVYQETQDGWCAIRPPIGSFSWASGEFVQLGMNNIGEVTVDGLASRIGSQVADECKTVQVRLKKGASVYVLDRVETPENKKSPYWYKIAPPKGEYRWIHKCAFNGDSVCHSKHLLNTQGDTLEKADYYSDDLAMKNQPMVVPSLKPEIRLNNKKRSERIAANSPDRGRLRESRSIVPVNYIDEQNEIAAETGEAAATLPEIGMPSNVQHEDGIVIPIITGNAEISTERTHSSIAETIPVDPVINRAIPAINPGYETPHRETPAPRVIAYNDSRSIRPELIDPFIAEFSEIQSEAYNVLNSSAEEWVLDVLIQRVRELVKEAKSEADRGRVDRLIEALEKTKYARNQILQLRQQEAIRKGKQLPESGTDIKSARSEVQPARLVERSPFHARGRLGRFNPAPEGFPPYAIADEQNQIVCYVTPGEGVDLNSQVGRTVGLNGQPGLFVKDGKSVPHLSATSVFLLGK